MNRNIGAMLLTLGVLALPIGCATETVYLRLANTGHTVKCGPYGYIHPHYKAVAFAQERACIRDYQRQGYERVPELTGRTPEKGGSDATTR